jgi:hypothetical protein
MHAHLAAIPLRGPRQAILARWGGKSHFQTLSQGIFSLISPWAYPIKDAAQSHARDFLQASNRVRARSLYESSRRCNQHGRRGT